MFFVLVHFFVVVKKDLNIFPFFSVFFSAMSNMSMLFSTMLSDISLILSLLSANISFEFMKPILVDARVFLMEVFSK